MQVRGHLLQVRRYRSPPSTLPPIPTPPVKGCFPKVPPPPINYSPRKTLTQAIKTNNSETLLNLKPRGNLQISHNQGDTSCKIFKCNIFT